MSADDEFRNVINVEFGHSFFEEAGDAPQELPERYRGTVRDLPVILGGMAPFRCSRCPRVFQPATWHVELGVEPICRYCAMVDPELAVWQGFCDAMDLIDHLMQQAGGRNRRLLLAQMLEKYAGHLARWRWPEEEPSEDGDRP